MLSQTSEYALRATIYIADKAHDRLVPVGEIAAALEVPANYLSKILHLLARDGVLASVRGPHGGFQLGMPPDRLPLARVVGLFDNVVTERRRCLLGRPECSDVNPCGAHHRWKSVAADVQKFFKETTVADVLANGALGRTKRTVTPRRH
jgi:Rrf2 family protein